MSFRRPVLAFASLLTLLAFSTSIDAQSPSPDTAAPASGPPYGASLIVNGDAEAQLGSPDDSHYVKPSGWKTTGNFTAIAYGASGGFPDATTPGPTERGKSLFEGGVGALATASQTVSLAPFAADIAAGGVVANLDAWLGGYSSQEDYAVVLVKFLTATGASAGSFRIGPVTAKDRAFNTGAVEAKKSMIVPKTARRTLVTITITRKDGSYNDGSVDNLSLVLARKTAM